MGGRGGGVRGKGGGVRGRGTDIPEKDCCRLSLDLARGGVHTSAIM